MQNRLRQEPLFRITAALVLLIALGFVLWVGQSILSTLAFSILIAMLILPLTRKLEGWGVARSVAILLGIFLVITVLGGIIYFFSYQAVSFQDQLPAIEAKGRTLVNDLGSWITERFGIETEQQVVYLEKAGNNILGEGGALFAQLSSFTGDLVTVLGLMPIYIFFLIYYRNFFMEFLARLFAPSDTVRVYRVGKQIEGVSQSYLLGLLTVMVVVAVLNTVGLLILGIPNAFFFGGLASLLTIIPYIGIFIGSILPALMALVTKDSAWYALGVVGLMGFVQFLEGNFITPTIVGSRVSVNPFAAIVALLVGGALWGAAGMILAIPIAAILKVIFDNVEGLEPFGYVIGEPPKAIAQKRKRGLIISPAEAITKEAPAPPPQ